MICFWNQGQFYFIVHKPSIILIHLSIKKSYADISTHGLLVKRPALCVSMEIFMQLITGHSQNLSWVGWHFLIYDITHIALVLALISAWFYWAHCTNESCSLNMNFKHFYKQESKQNYKLSTFGINYFC